MTSDVQKSSLPAKSGTVTPAKEPSHDWKRPAPGMSAPPPPIPPLSPIDFTRDDREVEEADEMEARAQEEAARMAAPAVDMPRAVDEATESVREEDLRDRTS